MNPDSRVVVIKIGTSSLLRPDLSSIKLSSLARICETVKELRNLGHRVVLVSSGAIGVGCHKMGLNERPPTLAQRQAVAAVGQIHLMRYYQDFFQALGMTCAQVLLTLNNLSDRGPYLNARSTFHELLAYDTVPIINENDTIAVEEIRFGDNDTLSSQVATLVKADWLFLLTDVDSLYTANPGSHPEAVRIPDVHDITKLQVDTSGTESQWGTGGMVTKLTAARIATAAGCTMVICSSSEPEAIPGIMVGNKQAGTVFHPLPNAVRDRKRWILSVPVKGELWLDSGAASAVRDHKKSLFAAGILKLKGDFAAQDAVVLCDSSGYEFARGLCNYTHREVIRVQGKSSKRFQDELGYVGSEEIIHRNNICLLSIIQNLETDGDLDGTPDPIPDEPSPMKLPQFSPPYAGMMNQTGIPGLTNQAWPPQQQEQHSSGFYQEPYPPNSLPMQGQMGASGIQSSSAGNNESYWHQQPQQPQQQQQQQQYGGNAQGQHQPAGHVGAAATHGNTQAGLPPKQYYPPGHQQDWHANSGGNAPPGIMKQEQVQHPFGAPPNRNPTLGSASSAPISGSSYASSPMAFGASRSFPPQASPRAAYDPFPPHAGPAPSGTNFPPKSSFPPNSISTSAGMSQRTGTHQPQQAHQGLANQAAAGQAHAQGYPPQDPRPAGGGRGKPHGAPAHKKRHFDTGPARSSGEQRHPYSTSGGHGRQSGSTSGASGGVQDRMRQLQSRGPQGEDETDWYSDLKTAIAAEQGTDRAMHTGMGVTGFMPSASPAWRDADFKAQPPAAAPPHTYGYNRQQPDVNEQGWLPR